jgi:hypothetical protein
MPPIAMNRAVIAAISIAVLTQLNMCAPFSVCAPMREPDLSRH